MRLPIEPGDDPVALVRAAAAESVVVVIPPDLDPMATTLATAVIASLAIERAPAVRVNAVSYAAGADPADVGAAIAFLESAMSTTGQVLAVS